MTDYLIKSTACSLILYLTYIGFFRNSRAYHMNRLVLLLSVFYALIVPALNMAPIMLQKFGHGHTAPLLKILPVSNYLRVSEPVIAAAQTDFPEVPFACLLVYAIVSTILLIRFTIHISLLLLKGYRADKVIHQDTTLALLNEKVNPFTFFHTIFITRESYENKTLDEALIRHEMAHKRQLHSVDVVILEAALVFFWLNPFLYLFRKLIKANHEYLADDFVLRSGISLSDYSNKIINYTFQRKTQSIVSGFNHLFIRNRLNMLSRFNQKKKPAWQLILFIPLLIVLFLNTAFKNTNDFLPDSIQGIFYADEIHWSGEKEIWIRGSMKVKFGSNDFTGKGSFSGFDRGSLLIVDGKRLSVNESVHILGKRCNLIFLTKEQAKIKLGTDGTVGVVQVNTSR
ncbi:hypothetical protein LZD49_04335 [Dyadobacter sp. CY261]|uniref:hypothetical protein n=1 Tax=Dyadobacter sp. CY261 TaxID=2907203 RepID=UPI001F3A084B|nr:hypothetical protein [Dyadobacter sp. CY261]MCF0069687.1 hypothetical protein [Dyadobacter sp. CY261]